MRKLALLILLVWPLGLRAAPTITVSGNSVSILGSAQSISLTCTLIDPNNTGMLRSGSNIITTFVTSTVTPGNVATCGPIYGNDVITDGFGNVNATYYKIQVFTVSNGIIASTPALQNFYAFVGSGTIDLSTATPLSPSFQTGTNGNVVLPGTLTVTGASTLAAVTATGLFTANGGLIGNPLDKVQYVGDVISATEIGAQIATAASSLSPGGRIHVIPKTGGGCYAATTLLNFNTAGKGIILEGDGIGNTCIKWAGLSAGQVAVSFNNANSTDGYGSWGEGIRDMEIRGPGICVAGDAGTATGVGIQVGGSNQIIGYNQERTRVCGFLVNFQRAAGDTQTFAYHFINNVFVSWGAASSGGPTQNFVFTTGNSENVTIAYNVFTSFGSAVANPNDVIFGGSPEIHLYGNSFDGSQVVFGSGGAGGQYASESDHYEMGPGVTNATATVPIVVSSGQFVSAKGTFIYDPTAAGTGPPASFISCTGTSNCVVKQPVRISSAQTIASFFACSGSLGCQFDNGMGTDPTTNNFTAAFSGTGPRFTTSPNGDLITQGRLCTNSVQGGGCPSFSSGGDIGTAQGADNGRVWFGSDGNVHLDRPAGANPMQIVMSGNTLTFPFQANDRLVARATTDTLTNKTLNTPLPSGTGLQLFNTTTTCTTGASVGAICTTAVISLPVAEADTSYRVTCTGKGLTNVPVVIATTNSSATQFTITIAALTAAAASFASYDCVAGHN